MLLQAHSIRKECDPMAVNESAENYLETILVLSKTHPVVRSVDIAEELGFKKSSVSVAMKNLREKNHITVTKEGFIYLTGVPAARFSFALKIAFA